MADRSATPEEFDGTAPDRTRQVVDLVAYSLSVLVVVFVFLGVVSVAFGGGLVGVKQGLFVVGMLSFGLAALKLRPTRFDKRDEARFPTDGGSETAFQSRVQRLVPKAYRLDHDERFPDALKLFVASLLVLVVSYLMETVFDVAVS